MSLIVVLSLLSLVAAQPYRIRCGGNSVTFGSEVWSADSYYTGGSTSTTTQQIGGTTRDALYQGERYGNPVYEFPVSGPGYYDVTLHFAEIYSGTQNPGQRVFHVLIGGERVIENLDIADRVGYLNALEIPLTVTVCTSKLQISFQTISGKNNPKISAISVIRNNTAGWDCPTPEGPKPAPQNAKYDYSEVLSKIWLFYEAQRSGDIGQATIRRLPWRRNSCMDVSNVGGVDLSGGYYESSNRMKFGLPLAATWTFIAWGIIEYREAYERTGELMYAMDAMKWATDYFINIHPSENVFYGQVGTSDYDFTWCGPPEEYNLQRPVHKLDTSKRGSEITAETAAAMAAASMVFRPTDPSYADTLLVHARQLYNFAKVYNGSYATSIPNHHRWYETSGYVDELAWAATWLFMATRETPYLDDAEYFHSQCCSVYAGWAFTWGEKAPDHWKIPIRRIGHSVLSTMVAWSRYSLIPNPFPETWNWFQLHEFFKVE